MAKKKDKAVTKSIVKTGKPGKSRGARKLNDTQVLNIVARYDAGGITMKTLAAEYGVSGATISAIVHGRTYAWLTSIGVEPLRQAA